MLTALTGPLRYRKAGERKRRRTWKELPTICVLLYYMEASHCAIQCGQKRERLEIYIKFKI